MVAPPGSLGSDGRENEESFSFQREFAGEGIALRVKVERGGGGSI